MVFKSGFEDFVLNAFNSNPNHDGFRFQYENENGNFPKKYPKRFLSKLSDFERAEEYLLNAIEILSKLDDKRGVPEFMIEYGSVLQNKGEYGKAITYASRAFDIAEKNDIREYVRDASRTLAGIYQ